MNRISKDPIMPRGQVRWIQSECRPNGRTANPGPGKNIPTLVTNKIRPDLKGYVDFWSISAQEWVDGPDSGRCSF